MNIGGQDTGRLNYVDLLTILYILLTSIILLAVTGINESSLSHYLVRLMMLAFIWTLTIYGKKKKDGLAGLMHVLYPLAFLAYFFPETDYIGQFFSKDLDTGLVYIEGMMFGSLPSESFGICCPWAWFNELMHLAYFSFYLIITFFVVYYNYKLPGKAVKRTFTFFLSFYLFYLIFMFFPTAGPQYFLHDTGGDMQNGYFFTSLMGKILEYGDRPTGAFPSSHIGITWLVMYFFFKDDRRMFFVWLLPAILLTLSTVYIRAHYAIDVVAGLFMVPLLLWSGTYFYDLVSSFDPLTKINPPTKKVIKP